MGKKKGPTPETKLQAVLSLLRKEEPGTKIARRYGVSETFLYKWRDSFLASGKQALAGKKTAAANQEIQQLRKEIEERDRVIGEITIANRILKKIQDGLF